MFRTLHTQRGFVKWVIIVVIAIIVLSYLGFDLRSIVEADQTQGNLHYVWELVKTAWDRYLEGPALWTWENIVKPVWELFTQNLNRLKNGDWKPAGETPTVLP